MPNLQKNCVFEYEYELISDYYSNINDWEIQEIFPVLYNEFNIQTPEYYKYQIVKQTNLKNLVTHHITIL